MYEADCQLEVQCVCVLLLMSMEIYRFWLIVNKMQVEFFWAIGPYPPRTIVEVHRLNDDAIREVQGTFNAPVKK